MYSIRLARPADAAELAELGARTFLDTFVHGFGIPYPPEDVALFIEANFSEAVTAARLADPAAAWWVGETSAGTIAGYAQAGPCGLPHLDARPSHGELKRLYVAKEAQGSGLGRTLLEAALAWMEHRFTGPEWIGVWSGNHKAQRLYAHYGFTKAGEYAFAVGSWRDHEYILRRER